MNETVRSPHGHAADELPKSGDLIAGKYRIESIIGSGGMGVVMGATDMSLGRACAIKFLAPAKAKREGAVPRFVREARAAASIQNEHVVRVFEVGTLPNGNPFIVMELLRGQDLAQGLVSRGAVGIQEGVDRILEVCEALGEAHARGIVHRDLKPQNLFVQHLPDGSTCLKVLDFGISKSLDDSQQNLTSTDMVMGTPLYMSPEQVRSLKNVDQRADIWALGSILFELLTCSPIFSAPSATALCAMIAMDPPTPLRARQPNAPAELEQVILRCLHKDPAGRFQDVAQLATALMPFASDRGRASAARISHVVRAGSSNNLAALAGSAPSIANAMGMGSGPGETTADGSGRPSVLPYQQYPRAPVGPSGLPPAAGFSAMPPAMHPAPNTLSTWQQTGDMTRSGRRSSPVLVAMLGVLTGFLVLLLVGGGAYYFVYRKGAEEAKNAPPPSTALATAAPAVTTAPTASMTIKPDAGPSLALKPTAGKDAGAPAPGVPTAPKPNAALEELEGKRRSHQAFCSHNHMMLTQNPDKSMLANIKTQSCLPGNSPDGARCERDNCRLACAKMNDDNCLRQVDYADSQMPAKY